MPLLVPTSPLSFEMEAVKGSRFLAHLGPVADAQAAQAFVKEVSTRYANATHNCWAWRIGTKGDRFRSSDDGEPGGSAGRPILAQIEGHSVTNTAIVVTRYFGGTKLGVGGLMRAYGGCAGKALDRAQLKPLIVRIRLGVRHPYNCSGAIQGVLARARLSPLEAHFEGDVRFELDVPEDRIDKVVRELRDAAGGRAQLSGLPPALE